MRLGAGTAAFTIEDQRREVLNIKAFQRSSGMLSTLSIGGRDKSSLSNLDLGFLHFKSLLAVGRLTV